MKMLKEVEEYWTRRAESYSDVVCHELNHSNEKSWMDVILKEIPEDKKIKIADMGTGPGFFAISLAKRGYDVTAVDYTQEMLNHAMQNAGTYASRITWMRGDVQNLENIQDGNCNKKSHLESGRTAEGISGMVPCSEKRRHSFKF